MITVSIQTRDIQSHYDKLSALYKLFWGNHIHHGYWPPSASPSTGHSGRFTAQLRLIEELARFASVRRGSRVLDIGCGLGGSAQWLARNLECTVLGLTLSPVQARMAKASVRRNGLQELVKIEVHDVNGLHSPERFDTVWLVECSEHIHDKAKLIANVHGLLKPGGAFALCAWLVADELPRHEDRKLAADVCQGMLCPSLASMREYSDWMRDAGFDRIRTRDLTREVEPTWDLCARISQRPEVQLILRTADHQTREFVQAFRDIRQAYATNVMRYGMFSAIRSRE